MTSIYDVLDLLAAAAEAGEAGDAPALSASAAEFADAVAGTAGAIGSYEADYVLRDLAAALDLDEPPEAVAARIRAALDRLRDLGL
jgi:hypothetical protein